MTMAAVCWLPKRHLLLIGTGSDQARLEQFARAIQGIEQIHFAGQVEDVPHLLAQAQIVWVPGQTAGGKNVALEAMAKRYH